MIEPIRRGFLGALCAGLLALGGAGTASADPPEPDFLFSSTSSAAFDGACGLAVDSKANLYVSDYYRHTINVYRTGAELKDFSLITQIAKVDPLDGPCGIDLDATGNLFANNYHRNVERFVPSAFPPQPKGANPATTYASSGLLDSSHPTGVAVDPATGNVYVNRRTHIAAYHSSGARILDGGEPLAIGLGDLGDGYGLAFSRYGPTAGRLYVADAQSNTVKSYNSNPALDNASPVQSLGGPGSGFVSLLDSALAVDRLSGELYVVDNLQPSYAERPQGAVYVFGASGDYEGRLKYNLIDAQPPGLAVDNSASGTQGRVYVTSGNAEGSFLYVYPRNSVTNAVAPPLSIPGFGGSGGAGGSGARSAALLGPPAPASAPAARNGASASAIAQKGTLRVRVDGRLSPKHLPRRGTAPIAVSVGGKVTTTDRSHPPRLRALRIELNRHGRLDATGLPTCPYDRIQPASTSRALAACRSALVGRGTFSADVSLAGQEPYPADGTLLAFNGVQRGRPVIFAQIYSPHPFATSFVIVFEIRRLSGGEYGTALEADLPEALGSWGNLTGLRMTLSRRYTFRGERRSYLSAGCPAPKGFGAADFPLARASFGFEGGTELSSTFTSTCKVSG
jgi:DNA-binding beta-propeller fold protein YncE